MCAYMPRAFPISGNQNTQYIMKHFLLKTWLIALMLVLGASTAWADWTRCTAVSDLTSGGTFIIGYEATANSGKIIPMKNTGGTATTSAAGYMASGSEIDMATVTVTTEYEFSIVASTTVKDAICIKAGENYIGIPIQRITASFLRKKLRRPLLELL